jgi:hypothetical protein
VQNSSDGDHFLLLRTVLWADAPNVIGIYDSEQGAREAAGVCFGPDRWTLEQWIGDVRGTCVRLEAGTPLH